MLIRPDAAKASLFVKETYDAQFHQWGVIPLKNGEGYFPSHPCLVEWAKPTA
jgi:hypothetical protein